MNKNITSSRGRWSLMLLVLSSAVLSFAVLFFIGRGGAIAGEAARATIKELLEIYLPLIAMMSAFYFGQAQLQSSEGKTSIEIFAFAIITVGLWVLCPPVLMMFGEAIEDIIETIDLLKPYGETIAAAAIAYYFAKSVSTKEQ